MKIKIIIVLLIVVSVSISSQAQGFVNLNFENAVIVTNGAPQSEAVASDALPGWTVYAGSTPQSYVVYNGISLSATAASILGTNGYPSSLSGAYSVLLFGGVTATAASIIQTGLVPISADSLLFEAQNTGAPGGTLVVSLGGQDLVFSALATEANFTLYGANISNELAGQQEQLEFSAPEGLNNYWEIDNIQFSASPVPEPGVLGLAALGGMVLAWRRWKIV